MGVSPQRRQRKLAKQHAKRKAEQKQLLRQQSQSVASKFHQFPLGSVLHCYVTNSLWETGIGNLWIGRRSKGQLVGYACFLLDVYCLGVKDSFGNFCSPPEYQARLERLTRRYEVTNLSLASARKLVEGAVEFAEAAGLAPHADYRYLKMIFDDADPATSTREFTYGLNGKHYFVAGPHDSTDRCNEIIGKLTVRFGVNGFHFTMPIHPTSGLDDLELLPDDVDELDLLDDDSADAASQPPGGWTRLG